MIKQIIQEENPMHIKTLSSLSLKHFFLLFSFMCAFVLRFHAPVAYAAAAGVSVDEFGAAANDSKDDTKAIQQALNEAMDASGTTTVQFSKGTYIVSEPLSVYPNTHIILNSGTVVLAKKGFNAGNGGGLFYGVHLDNNGDKCGGYEAYGCKHAGYSQCHHVTIEGGTLDGNTANSNLLTAAFIFRHAKNITFKNLTIQNFTRHVVNISGSSEVLVDHVTIRDCSRYTGSTPLSSHVEVIHTDFTCEGCDNAWPSDSTPAQNIIVQNCHFENVRSGIGSHTMPKDKSKYANNIKVINCSFRNLLSYCVRVCQAKNVQVKGCTYDCDARYLIENLTSSLPVDLVNNTYSKDKPQDAAPTPEPEQPTEKEEKPADTKNQKLSVNFKKATLKVGKSKTIKAKAVPANTITFKSSKPAVASVDRNGKIKALKAGKATITVSCNGKNVKIKITVKKK